MSYVASIFYKGGFKYQTTRDYMVQTDIRPMEAIDTGWVKLSVSGLLWIKGGYAWDGPSGPTIDTKNFMRGSMVHDALYQLMRLGLLDRIWKDDADKLLQAMIIEDTPKPDPNASWWSQMKAWTYLTFSKTRAMWVYYGVSWFGEKSTLASSIKPELKAP